MGDKARRQPAERGLAPIGLLAERQRQSQVRALEHSVAIGQKALDQAVEARRGGREGCAQEVGDALGDLLGNDQGLHV